MGERSGGELTRQTIRAIKAARAGGYLQDADEGSLEAIVMLARKIDAWDRIVEYALEDLEDAARGARPAVPQNDNVSLSSYLKYSDQLGLTPAGRKALDVKKGAASGKSAKLTALRGGNASAAG